MGVLCKVAFISNNLHDQCEKVLLHTLTQPASRNIYQVQLGRRGCLSTLHVVDRRACALCFEPRFASACDNGAGSRVRTSVDCSVCGLHGCAGRLLSRSKTTVEVVAILQRAVQNNKQVKKTKGRPRTPYNQACPSWASACRRATANLLLVKSIWW